MSSKIYLVTGASRGIGKGVVSELLLRENATVIAAVRDLQSTASGDLEVLPKGPASRLFVVQIDAASDKDASTAASHLTQELGISHVDVIIANAGMATSIGPAVTASVQDVQEHFVVNALGPLKLFQAFWPLLRSTSTPKFVAISTAVGSITDMANMPMPFLAYGTSKAALNYIVRKIHFENEALVSFVISPGWVQTDMGNAGAVANGLEKAPLTVKESVDGILGLVAGATREATSGTFRNYDGGQFNW